MIPRRALGATGEELSIIGIGGWDVAAASSEAESIAIMHEAIDAGVNFFDNCWEYHEGYAEEVMGKALRGSRRDRVFLMTKGCGRTYEDAKQHLEDSLRRMQVEMIDLWQFHAIKRDTDPDLIFNLEGGAMRAALKAREEGKIRYIGFTGHASPRFHLAMLERDFPWAAVQMPTNVLDAHYDSFEHQVLPVLNERRIGALGMKSLAAQSGRIVREVGISANHARRYALSLPITSLICGIQSREELRHDIALADDFVPLTAEEKAELLRISAPHAADGHIEDYKVGDWGCNFHAKKAAG